MTPGVERFLETQFEILRQPAQAWSGLDSALVYVAGALEALVQLVAVGALITSKPSFLSTAPSSADFEVVSEDVRW